MEKNKDPFSNAVSAMTSSFFYPTFFLLVFFILCLSIFCSIIHTEFLKHTHSHPRSPRAPHFSSPPSSATLTLCVIQSSQGDGYPSPRSAYALHFLKRLIRLIDCPPSSLHPPPFLPSKASMVAEGVPKSGLH